jgi:nucleoside-diphosphate-sugar epimerase
MAAKPTVLITGISGSLGLRLVEQLEDFQVIGVDIRDMPSGDRAFRFEKVDLGEERSCRQLLDLMGSYRPETVVHLAFVTDRLRSSVANAKAMWNINVVGTSRVIEAIAEHNRMVGGVEKFVFSSSTAVYGPEPGKQITEKSPLNAQGLDYALHQQEADQTVQARAESLRRCKTYILRSHPYSAAGAHNYHLQALRGLPSGQGYWGKRLHRQGARLPLWLPSRGDHMEHRSQFVHVDDVARLIAHIAGRKQSDGQLTILNVAGRGDPLLLSRCLDIAAAKVKRAPAKVLCRYAVGLLWRLGISGVPPAAFPYVLGSCTTDLAPLRVFLGEHYRSVIQQTCEDALRDAFSPAAEREVAAALRA